MTGLTINVVKSSFCVCGKSRTGISASRPMKKRTKFKPRKLKPKTTPFAYRSTARIAKAFLNSSLTFSDPRSPDIDKAAYAAFHMEMKEKHQPELIHQIDTVERATELHWRLRRLVAWEADFFGAMKRAVDSETSRSVDAPAKFGEILEILLRNNGLEKISKYEAKLREQAKEVDLELRELSIWRAGHGLDRGSIEFLPAKPPELDVDGG